MNYIEGHPGDAAALFFFFYQKGALGSTLAHEEQQGILTRLITCFLQGWESLRGVALQSFPNQAVGGLCDRKGPGWGQFVPLLFCNYKELIEIKFIFFHVKVII